MTNILRTKKMLKFALSSVLKESKNASSINPASKTPILIRNDSLASEKSKVKTVCKYLVCRLRLNYEHFS